MVPGSFRERQHQEDTSFMDTDAHHGGPRLQHLEDQDRHPLCLLSGIGRGGWYKRRLRLVNVVTSPLMGEDGWGADINNSPSPCPSLLGGAGVPQYPAALSTRFSSTSPARYRRRSPPRAAPPWSHRWAESTPAGRRLSAGTAQTWPLTTGLSCGRAAVRARWCSTSGLIQPAAGRPPAR